MRRGEIWWVDLGVPRGSGPGFLRPCVIVSSNAFNESAIDTIVVASMSSNLRLADMRGNFRVPARLSGLSKPSVVVVSQLTTIDKDEPKQKIGRLPDVLLPRLNAGLQMVLGLI